MSRPAPRLAIIGAGRMGGALVRAWAENYPALAPGEILVVDPIAGAREDAEDIGCQAIAKADKEKFFSLDTVIVAIKPQALQAVAAEVAAALPAGVLLISIVAGPTLETLKALFPGTRVVRAMPNTPAAYGSGATAFVPADDVTEGQIERTRALLEAGGLVEQIPDEKLMDAVTAVSGSGPAYVFLLAEAMAEAGVKEGLPRALAERLAISTVAGAGVMLIQKGANPKELRQAVTSSGGTTEAALGVLRASDGLVSLMESAISAAAWRARELGK